MVKHRCSPNQRKETRWNGNYKLLKSHHCYYRFTANKMHTGAHLAAWHFPGGSVGPPAWWDATSNVKEQRGTARRIGREGSTRINYMQGPPEFLVTPLLMGPVRLISRAGLKSQCVPECKANPRTSSKMLLLDAHGKSPYRRTFEIRSCTCSRHGIVPDRTCSVLWCCTTCSSEHRLQQATTSSCVPLSVCTFTHIHAAFICFIRQIKSYQTIL